MIFLQLLHYPSKYPAVKAAYKKIISWKRGLRATRSSTEIAKYKLPEKLEETISHRIIECTPVYEAYKVVLGFRRFVFQKWREGL